MSFLIQWFYVLGLSLWIGGIVFFSFFTTPTLFINLPRDMASQVVTVMFPRYYMLGYVCGGVMLVSTLIEAILVRQLPLIRIVLIALMLGGSIYAGVVIRPQAHNLKIEMKALEEGSERYQTVKSRFDGMHRLSVSLNVAVLVLGLVLLGILAFRLRL